MRLPKFILDSLVNFSLLFSPPSQVIGEQQLLLHDDLVDSSELNMDDLLPIANDAPAATSTTSSFKH